MSSENFAAHAPKVWQHPARIASTEGTTMAKRLAPCSVVVAGLVTLLAVSPASAIDPFFPTHGNKGYDVLHYDLDLAADPVANTLRGTAKLSIKAISELNKFQLDLHCLGVDKVTVDGDPAGFSQTKDKLTIEPKHALPDGRLFEVVVTYAGTPKPITDPTTPGEDVLPLGWLRFETSTNALSAPVGASSFFPSNDEPTDRATYSISVSVPKPYIAVANGLQTKTDDLGGSRRFHYKMAQPMTTWLATVQISKFRVIDQKAAGIPVLHYVTKNVTDAQIDEFSKTPEYMSWLGKLVAPYPFDSYGSITIDDRALDYALETQAISTFPRRFIDRRNQRAQSLIVHELAHQWFGNSMSVAGWRDVWIAEGFATYFEILYLHRNEPEQFDNAMLGLYDDLVEKKVGPAVVSRPEDMFADNTYYRGSVTLFALRQHVGEPVFWKIIQTFYNRYKFRTVTTADFIDVAVEVSHDPSVKELLDAWLFEEPVPALPGVAAKRVNRAAEGRAFIENHLARRAHGRR
jgi:aminopeptidase N